MKQYALTLCLTAIFTLSSINLIAADKNTFDFSRTGGYRAQKSSVSWSKKIQQGYNFRVWLSNQLVLGQLAFDDSPPPICGTIGIGCEYPLGSCIEHLYGGGPWIGGIQDGIRKVTEGYNGDNGYGYLIPEQKDTLRDQFYLTSIADTLFEGDRFGFYKKPMNQRSYDDDNDGKRDEDELDGLDNDGDWVRANDDVGADGVPDSLENGCRGAYDPIRNPDPAYDNYAPSRFDSCHPNPNGSYRRMMDKNRYTENNGLTDHGEPRVDEDYAAISENDIYVAATDTFRYPTYAAHRPLSVKVFMKSYAWQGKDLDAVLPIEYQFINIGKKPIYDAYVGFFADIDLGPVSVGTYYNHNFAAYLRDLRTAYIHNGVDRGSTPLGLTVLSAPKPLASLKYIFQWFDFSTSTGPGTVDSSLYSWMSGEAFPTQLIKQDQPVTNPSDTRFFFSFGPFDTLDVGDTLKIAVALVSGYCVDECPGSLVENAQNALKLHKRGYYTSKVPPSPPLKITEGFKKVTLEWGSRFGGLNPMDIWDDSNKVVGALPDTHWRRRNPPVGHITGGRIFEGYRLYRSEDPAGSEKSFTLLKQFDVPDDDFGYNVGLDSFFVDSNLVRGKTYWYAVTSFGLPDVSILEIPDSAGNIRFDTLLTANTESSILTARKKVDLTFSASENLGEVLVVPNPYRVDQDYTFENGGWEGRSANWTENNRLVKFIHLPKEATIRIFTMAGDLVTTLNNYGLDKYGEITWNLLSESNRALASGTYVFTVESSLGRQIGKFVLIR